MAAGLKKSRFKRRAAAWFHQLREYLKIRRNRWEYDALDPSFQLRELNPAKDLVSGDIAYCEMPFSDWELAGIPKGHRCRPYLIVENGGDYLVGFPCSHNRHKKAGWRQVCLRQQEYRRHLFFGDQLYSAHDSYINLQKPFRIRLEKVLSRTNTLQESDRLQVNRILEILHTRQNHKKLWQVGNEPLSRRPGDIVDRGGSHLLISSCDKDVVYGYLVLKNTQERSELPAIATFNGKTLRIEETSRQEWKLTEKDRLMSFCLTRDLLALEKTLAKRSRKAKAKEQEVVFSGRLSFRVQPGEIFYVPFIEEEFIYLFSRGQFDYGMLMEDFYDENFQVRKENVRTMERQGQLIAPEEMSEIALALQKSRFISESAAALLEKKHHKAWEKSAPEEPEA